MSKETTSNEIATKQQLTELATIQKAFNAGQKSVLEILEQMHLAGKAAITLRKMGLTQVEIAEKSQATQPFVSQSTRFYHMYPEFTAANPPEELQGKTMREVWHDVLPKKHRSQVPSVVPTPEPVDALCLSELSSSSLAGKMEVGLWNRLLNMATEQRLTFTVLVAQLLTEILTQQQVAPKVRNPTEQ